MKTYTYFIIEISKLVIFGQKVVFNIEIISEAVLIMNYFLLFVDKEYPLAMKIMFNFHAESNSGYFEIDAKRNHSCP